MKHFKRNYNTIYGIRLGIIVKLFEITKFDNAKRREDAKQLLGSLSFWMNYRYLAVA